MSTTDSQSAANGNGSGIKREIALIPAWAYVVAVCVFLTIPSLFFGVVWPREETQPAQFVRLLVPILVSIALAFYALMIGYVNRDAGRRGMSRLLWTIIVILVPNALGFILYFLLRNPIRAICPKCGAVVNPSVNYCPSCRYSFHPTCPHCKAAVRSSDEFCANCGAQIEHGARS
jgi:RNA polymerase subunit RPABC4/transcription elongation factor Spt4